MKTPNPDNPIRNTLKHLALGVAAAAAFFTSGPSANATPVTDGLALWLDASDSSTMTLSGSTVNEWRDKNGSAAKMTRATGTPTVAASGIGGIPTVHFTNGSSMGDGVNHSAPVTIFYVSRQTGGANRRVLSGGNNWLLGYWGGKRGSAFFNGDVLLNGNGTSDTNPHLYAATIPGPGQNSTVWAEGLQIASNQGGTVGPNGLFLGGGGVFSEYSDCDISEVLVYHRILDATELEAVGGYLTAKYGLTTNYPTGLTVALTSPVNGSDYLVGATIPATATVLAGTAPYTVDFPLDSGSGFGSQGTDSDSPYTVNLTGLAIGSYSIKAAVTDSTPVTPATAESAVKTFTVSNAGPTNLAAVSGNQLVNLSWNQVLGATGYTVFRSSPDNSSYSEIATGITDLTYQDTGLINGTPYYYVVKATVGATVSDPSNEVSSTPLAVDNSKATVVASAPFVLADGVATSTITVTLKDGGNAPAPDLTVTLASSRPSDDTVSAASGLSDGNGVVTFTVKSSVVGTSEYTATVTDIPLTLTQKATVGFVGPAITPTGAIASSQYSGSYDAGNLIDDSALSGTAPHTIGDTHTGNAVDTAWLSSGATLPQTVTFDLGSSYLLTAMHIWQYGHPSANYSKAIKVQFSTTGTGGAFGGDVDITLANGAATVSAQTFAIPSITANAVKFTITSRAGGPGEYVGLSEVKFSAVSSGFATWAAANGATGQTPDQDHDNDGVENGIEYFMGQTGSSFTAMPGLDAANTISWPADAAYQGTYEVQTSPDLVTWTNVDPKPLPSEGNLSYLLPTGLGKQFVRLLVTPAP